MGTGFARLTAAARLLRLWTVSICLAACAHSLGVWPAMLPYARFPSRMLAAESHSVPRNRTQSFKSALSAGVSTGKGHISSVCAAGWSNSLYRDRDSALRAVVADRNHHRIVAGRG